MKHIIHIMDKYEDVSETLAILSVGIAALSIGPVLIWLSALGI